MVNKAGRDVCWRRSSHNKIEITNDLLSPSITSGDADMKCIRMRAEVVLQCFRLSCDASQLKGTNMFGSLGNRPTKFLLGRSSETCQFGHFSRFAGRLKLRNGTYPEPLVKRFDLF